MKPTLNDHFEKLDRLRHLDDGSSVFAREIERELADFKYDIWLEINDRRLKELGMKEVIG